MFNFFQKKDKYAGYSKETREYCEYRDKYQDLYLTIGEYTEQINSLYSQFINNKDQEIFKKLLDVCLKYIELLPNLEEAHKEDTKINGTKYNNNYCLPYHKLAMAYEKAECYLSAMNVCKEAIKKGYGDGTKGGFEARLKKLEEKYNNTMKQEAK